MQQPEPTKAPSNVAVHHGEITLSCSIDAETALAASNGIENIAGAFRTLMLMNSARRDRYEAGQLPSWRHTVQVVAPGLAGSVTLYDAGQLP